MFHNIFSVVHKYLRVFLIKHKQYYFLSGQEVRSKPLFLFLPSLPRCTPSLSSHHGWWHALMLLPETWWHAAAWTTCALSTTSRAKTATSRSCVSWPHTPVNAHRLQTFMNRNERLIFFLWSLLSVYCECMRSKRAKHFLHPPELQATQKFL